MDRAIEQVVEKFTYGIYLLTCRYREVNHGMIVSWVSQISYDPPLLVTCVKKTRRILPVLEETGHFALHVLENTQKVILSSFKHPDPTERFSGLSYQILPTGVPVLTNVLGYVECEIKEKYTPGDHVLVIGEILSGESFKDDGDPLTCYDLGKVYLGKY